MAHTIVTDVCEGVADCVEACPVACIHEGPGKNVKGTDWYWIDFATCIDCGICFQVCPVEGAIVQEERPDLQKTPQWAWGIGHGAMGIGYEAWEKKISSYTKLFTHPFVKR